MPSDKPEIKIRASSEQKQRWQAMAEAEGLSLSAWLAGRADAVATPSTPPAIAAAAPVLVEPPAPVEEPQAPARVRQTVDPETLTDEEYAAWLDEYPSRAMAPGYTIKEWRAMTPMARAAAAIRGGPLSAA